MINTRIMEKKLLRTSRWRQLFELHGFNMYLKKIFDLLMCSLLNNLIMRSTLVVN